MSRAQYHHSGRFSVTGDAPVPPRAGEVRLSVAYTGICGTDLHIARGHMDHRVPNGGVVGHEMSGRIAAIGPDVSGWSVGDPVTVMPLAWCGECPACQAGHTHVCHRLSFIGIDAPGSMQSSWTVPAGLLVRLPSHVPLPHAALVEPTAVAVHDVRRAHLQPGEKVLVIGGGPVGLLIAIVARHGGADVTVVEVNPHRRQVGVDLGLTLLDPTATDVDEYVRTWTAEAGAAATFEVSGSADGVAMATRLLAVRGRLVLVAIHASPREVDLHRFFWRELHLVGARVYQRQDFERAVDLIADGVIPGPALITEILPLARVADAFAALEAGGPVVKLLLDCQEVAA
jgi:2-desacetyl-2-hydroxyethyl bacteriochlorophyllide A dehydrogenase